MFVHLRRAVNVPEKEVQCAEWRVRKCVASWRRYALRLDSHTIPPDEHPVVVKYDVSKYGVQLIKCVQLIKLGDHTGLHRTKYGFTPHAQGPGHSHRRNLCRDAFANFTASCRSRVQGQQRLQRLHTVSA